MQIASQIMYSIGILNYLVYRRDRHFENFELLLTSHFACWKVNVAKEEYEKKNEKGRAVGVSSALARQTSFVAALSRLVARVREGWGGGGGLLSSQTLSAAVHAYVQHARARESSSASPPAALRKGGSRSSDGHGRA